MKHGPVKASVHPVEYHITRETAVEIAGIIIDHQFLINSQMMMLVIIIGTFLA